MSRQERAVDMDMVEQQRLDGVPWSDIAADYNISRQALCRKVAKERPALLAGEQLPFASSEAPEETLQGDLLLPWSVIEEYLSTGMSLAETATAAGVPLAYLREQYTVWPDKTFDSLDTWGAVLRARRSFELLHGIERRAKDGDLRAFICIQKARWQRWHDSPEPIKQDRMI